MNRRLRLGAGLALAAVLLVRAPAPPAGGFELGVHEVIVRAALSGQIDDQGLEWVIGDRMILLGHIIPLGGGNLGSDQHQFAPERHFDMASSPADICTRRNEGLAVFMNLAVALTAPDMDGRLGNRKGALESFGEATHSLADFYAHTNWIELAFDQCPHRMACAKCSFYRPKGSSQAQMLEAKINLLRLREDIPLTDDERAAVDDGLAALEKLCAGLVDVPTPAGPTPRELASRPASADG